MPTILLATIGKRDPFDRGEPTGPLRLARETKPDRALLVATAAVRAQAEATAAELQALGIEIAIDILDDLRRNVPDLAVSVSDLLLAGRDLIRRRPELKEAEVITCFTSGTPQMSIAFTLVVRSLLPRARHFQALNPAEAQGNPLREFDPDALVHLDARDRTLEALAAGNAAAALAAGEPLLNLPAGTPPPWDQKALKAAVTIARALVAVENYQRQWLRQVAANIPARAGGADLSHLKSWLERCSSDDLAWGAELAACSLRLQAADRPAQAILVAATAAEVIISAGLRRAGIDPDDIRDPARLPSGFTEKDRVSIDGGRWRIEGLQRRAKLLEALSPAYRRAVEEQDAETLRARLAGARNEAVHQGRQVTGEALEAAAAYLRILAEAVGAPAPSSLPTIPSSLSALVQLWRT
ncbi:hypothetical protein [Tepidiforma thermophila]|uniref:TIGR02710 family CRISPR-associated protein n=1 Tax=Tepidiforma thermophila (strain KCTC 52669 / CGMCC 1.13589 / G233) TaxID=2761530 RepID=A0A2A9HCQ9_TEPT2|nr:hypothetical protein [Tepidiforma thermophila]PFG73558.1 hypothetical protein A9A59_0758 [Tepidiforma thermophila]